MAGGTAGAVKRRADILNSSGLARRPGYITYWQPLFIFSLRCCFRAMAMAHMMWTVVITLLVAFLGEQCNVLWHQQLCL